jgi:hypothetical protein
MRNKPAVIFNFRLKGGCEHNKNKCLLSTGAFKTVLLRSIAPRFRISKISDQLLYRHFNKISVRSFVLSGAANPTRFIIKPLTPCGALRAQKIFAHGSDHFDDRLVENFGLGKSGVAPV